MHKPVMVREVLEYLNPPVGGVVVDATVGAGGHARALAERIGREGLLIALDRDAQMLALAQQNLADIACTAHYLHADYRSLPEVLHELQIDAVAAILVDMGVCSEQLDDPERGLAFRYDAPLDMRLDRESLPPPTTCCSGCGCQSWCASCASTGASSGRSRLPARLSAGATKGA